VVLDADRFHRGRGDQAVVYQLQLVGSVPVKAYTTGIVDPEANPSPPAEAIRSASDLLDLHDTLDTCQSAKLLGDKIALESSLRRDRDVLPVTASTSSRPRVSARRRHAVWGGLDDLEGVCPQVRLRFLGDHSSYALAR
jgi:hypothetical protein